MTFHADNKTTTAAVASVIVRTTPGYLFGISWMDSVSEFIQIFDSATLPADTTVPTLTFDTTASKAGGVSWPGGRWFANGVVISNSSTAQTKTIGGATLLVDAQTAAG